MKRILVGLVKIVIVFGIWHVGVSFFSIPSYLVPSVHDVLSSIYDNRILLLEDTLRTAYEVVAAFCFALVVAAFLNVLSLYSRTIDDHIQSFLVTMQVVPKIALAPLALVWLGYGPASKILIAALVCFFPIALAMQKGLKEVNQSMVDILMLSGISNYNIILSLRVPSSLPDVFAGLKVGMALAVVGAIVAEFVAGSAGLGYRIAYSATLLDAPVVFAAIAFVVMLGLSLNSLITVLEKKIVFWR